MGIEPRLPAKLHPLAREVLEELSLHPQASAIIVGGGVALAHYCEFRETIDLDAWWAVEADRDTERSVREAMEAVAARHGLDLAVRSWRETLSFELRTPEPSRRTFSFQISRRTIELLPPHLSAWAPVRLEAFEDNLGAKMNALVQRGAPRDILDVREVCRRGLTSIEECWVLWQRKNPGADLDEAKLEVLQHLEAIEARRPLESFPDAVARDSAREVRLWVRGSLCARTGCRHED